MNGKYVFGEYDCIEIVNMPGTNVLAPELIIYCWACLPETAPNSIGYVTPAMWRGDKDAIIDSIEEHVLSHHIDNDIIPVELGD